MSQTGGSNENTAPSMDRTRGCMKQSRPPPSPPALGAGGKAEGEQGDPASQTLSLALVHQAKSKVQGMCSASFLL